MSAPMDAQQAAMVLESMSVPGWPGVYVLGCIDRRVTIYSQQVRALNLAAALVASAQVKPGDQVVVVGAGAAGLTCAAGLRRLGARPTVLEKKPEPLSLFRLGSQRWLHPGVYDWPLDGWDRDRADLPVLDWEHGRVNAVREQFEDAWEQEREGIDLHLQVEVGSIGMAGEARRKVTRGSDSTRTHTVVLAVGFGLEPTLLADERGYWEADDFDSNRACGPQRWLVSGCGDGALTDLFRLCIKNFRHDRMLVEFTADPRMETLRERIREIEADASIQQDPAKLHDAYQELHAPWVVDAIENRRRGHEVTLVARTADFLSKRASPLNRFLAAQLLHARRFTFFQDNVLDARRVDGEVLVEFETNSPRRFDRILRRHGPESALESGFPAIAKALAEVSRGRRDRPTLTDQTRERFWSEGAFGEPRARSVQISAPGASSGPAGGAGSDALSLEELERYRSAMRARHGCNQFIGFHTPFEYSVDWEQLYVELDMRKAHGHSRRSSFAEGDEEAQQTDKVGLDDAFAQAHRCNRRAMVLLGNPGSGKTTQLRQMLLRALADDDGPARLGLPRGTVPVYVELRELSLPPSSEPLPRLEQLVRQALTRVDGVDEALAGRILTRPNVLYLLDGLDEVADEQQRIRMAQVIAAAQQRLTRQHLLVSSRYAGYADVEDVHLNNAFVELRLQPLSDAQVVSMVKRWHEAVEDLDARDQGRSASPEVAEGHAREFLAQLRSGIVSNDRLGELSRTPLLLTVLCLIHRHRGSQGGLPSRRSEIYEECERVLLDQWQRDLKGRQTFDRAKARGVLEYVAYWLHTDEERRTATNAELCQPVAEGLEAVGYEGWSPEGFIRSFASESGLLTPWGVHQHGFIHLGFQEYLAARHIRTRWAEQRSLLATLVESGHESWWREVARMTFEDATSELQGAFVRDVLRAPQLAAWSRTSMLAGVLRASTRTALAELTGLLRGAEADEARLTIALTLLVWRVLPGLSEEQVRTLDAWLREHPSQVVRRRWLTRAMPSERPATTRNETSGVELVHVPTGWFLMGSAHDAEWAYGGERPQHEVELDGFYMAKTPVTNAQYAKFLDKHPKAAKPKFWEDERYNQPDQPVVGVSWDDAKAYCDWAGLKLPTEAQWEYACRAGTTTQYWSGDGEGALVEVGWYWGNSERRLHPVGEKPANPFGLYDMHGNVWEWCLDGWGASYSEPVRDKDGLRRQPVDDSFRVVRGGSWVNTADNARSAYRVDGHPGNRYGGVGFRPVQGIH